MKRGRSQPQLISSSNQLSQSNQSETQKQRYPALSVCSMSWRSNSHPFVGKNVHPNKKCRSIQVLISQFHKIMRAIQKGSSEYEYVIQGVMLHARSCLTLEDCINIRYTNKLCYILKRHNFKNEPLKNEVKSQIQRIISLVKAESTNCEKITEIANGVTSKLDTMQKSAEQC